MPVDYSREFDPAALMRALGYEDDYDAPAKARARAAALRGDPGNFGQESAAGMGGMMLRGPTAEKVSNALYTSGERGKRAYADQVDAETQSGREVRKTALTQTMANQKDKRATEEAQREFDANENYRKQNLSLQWAQENRAREQMAMDEWSTPVADPNGQGWVVINKRTGEPKRIALSAPGGGYAADGTPMSITGAAGAPNEKYTESQRTGAVRSGEGTIALGNALNAGFPDEGRISSVPDTLMGMANRAGFPQAASDRVVEQNTFWSNVADPIVRARTGAAMPVEEFNNQMAMLVPRPGESPRVQMQKAQQLVAFLKSGTVGLPPEQQQNLLRQLAQIERSIPQDQDAWDQMRFQGGQPQQPSQPQRPASSRNLEAEYADILGGK